MVNKKQKIFWSVSTLFVITSHAQQSCSPQDTLMNPGKSINITIPSTGCYSAELQYKDGNHKEISAVSSSCPGSAGSSNFTWTLGSQTPTGPMNLTFLCSNLGPFCNTYQVVQPSTADQEDEMQAICSPAQPPYPAGGQPGAQAGSALPSTGVSPSNFPPNSGGTSPNSPSTSMSTDGSQGLASPVQDSGSPSGLQESPTNPADQMGSSAQNSPDQQSPQTSLSPNSMVDSAVSPMSSMPSYATMASPADQGMSITSSINAQASVYCQLMTASAT